MLKLPSFITNLIRFFRINKERDFECKVNNAVKQIELHYRELESLKKKFESRRLALFEVAVREVERGGCAEASVYTNEYTELKRVIEAISYSKLALTFVAVKLESMRDMKDVIYHVSSALKLVKGMGKIVSNLNAMLESFTEEINSTLAEITVGYGSIISNMVANETFEDCEEVLERAKICARERLLMKGVISNPKNDTSQFGIIGKSPPRFSE
ncbi:MAG: hypothetical protein RMJ31_04455, partial [Nitrososphaerota archaeon]|nr:hypothetical protein [Nitrososphaerales archaeon]MDW8045006.1 hypothetical protein [Nitrososphaerota archaeon]